MTSKERMLTAIHHAEPDRVPVGEWEYGAEITGPLLGEKPVAFTGLALWQALWSGRRDAVVAQWKRVLASLVEKLQWDALLLHMVMAGDARIEAPEPAGDGEWRLPNGDTLVHMRETDRLFVTRKATASAPPPPADLAEVARSAYVEPDDAELEIVRWAAREFGRTHFLFSCGIGGHPRWGYEDATSNAVEGWIPLYEDPQAFHDRYAAMLRAPALRGAIRRVKREGLDGVAYSWDFGCNTGPFARPELFRQSIQPFLAGFCELAHREGLVVLLHSCGNNRLLMDMIVEAGVDVYQSIQPEMNIFEMKKRYGKNITLWGGVPAGELVLGTPASARAAAEKCLRACSPGGGYVFGTSHSVMPGAKYENYLAMRETAWRFRRN